MKADEIVTETVERESADLARRFAEVLEPDENVYLLSVVRAAARVVASAQMAITRIDADDEDVVAALATTAELFTSELARGVRVIRDAERR